MKKIPVIPAWTQRFLDIYKAGVAHAFILHFNTGDYVTPESPVTLTAYLAQLFASRDIAAIYSRDKGITFPVESMRQDALDILGIAQQQGQSGNATLEALQSLGMV
ncbi:MAG TPA: hypothetical protein ENK24_06825, partial [Anaerolineae bacterium]|nr:hypothetical protein [Anaerolineae bacterium]